MLIVSGLQILGSVASGSWYFWDANLSFGIIGGFTLASWATLGRFWDTGEHNKGIFEVQAWIFTDFWQILMPTGVIWHAWCLYFTLLGDPGTILRRAWGIREDIKDIVRTRLGFYRFLVDLGDPFRKIFGSIWTEKHDFVYLFPGYFF